MKKIDERFPAVAPLWPALILTILAAGYRILLAWQTAHAGGHAALSWLPGFYPLAAIALCGGRFLPRPLALTASLGLLLVSDFFADWFYSASFFSPEVAGRYVFLAGLALAGGFLRRRSAKGGALLLATAAGSLSFYVLTNTLSWFTAPEYARSIGGWWQALTTGLPGYPPSWIFFRNALVSDLLYSMVMAVSVRRGAWSRFRLARLLNLARRLHTHPA